MDWLNWAAFLRALGLIGIGEIELKNLLMKLDLQLFAEEQPSDQNSEQIRNPYEAGNPEFDAAVSKAVNTALENNDKNGNRNLMRNWKRFGKMRKQKLKNGANEC